MPRSRTATRTFLALLLCGVAVAVSVAGCGDKGGAGDGLPGAESPEALAAKVRRLVESDDYAGVINTITPDERPMLALTIVMVAQRMPAMMSGIGGRLGSDAAKAEFAKEMKAIEDAVAAAMKNHGMDAVNMQAAGPVLMGKDYPAAAKLLKERVPDLNHGAFIADVMGALGERSAAAAKQRFKRLGGELTDLKVDGDWATGIVGGNPAEFVKVDGRWYVSAKNTMGR